MKHWFRIIIFIVLCGLLGSGVSFSAISSNQDYRNYTEVDPGDDITVSSDGTKVTYITLPRNVTSYVYDDFGVNYFGADWSHDFTLHSSGGSDFGIVAVAVLANTVDDIKGMRDANVDYLTLLFYKSGTLSILLEECNAGSRTSSSLAFATGTVYYCTLYRDSGVGANGTVYLYRYSDVARTSEIDNMSLALTEDQWFRYRYAVNSFNSGGANTLSGYIEDDNTLTSDSVNYRIAASTVATTMPYPSQSAIFNDGKYFNAFYRESNIRTVYADVSDSAFGTSHALAYQVANTLAGFDADIFYSQMRTYGIYAALTKTNGTAKRIASCYKDDGNLNASSYMTNYFKAWAGENTASRYPAVLIDAKDYVWQGMREYDGANYKIVVTRTSGVFNTASWDSPTTLKTLGSASGIGQGVSFLNGDIGWLYTDNTTLYYKHYTESSETWGSEETVVSADVIDYRAFKGVVTQNDKLFVTWKSANTDLDYKIRDGSWGSAAVIGTDANSGSWGQFASTADVGKVEVVYIFYHDGTGLIYRTWNGSSISGTTTLITKVDIDDDGLTSPPYESEIIPLMFHYNTLDLRMLSISITPDTFTSDGVLVSKDGKLHEGTQNIGQSSVSYNSRTFTVYGDRDHTAWGRIYNWDTPAWEGSWVSMIPRYWDYHNTINLFISDGYAYIGYGGRDDAGTTSYVKVYKSDYQLDSGSFTADLSADWTDISPAEDANSTGRGYKWIIIDNYGIPHLFFQVGGGGGKMLVRQYSKKLAYDGQTVNFTVGLTVTDGTSGATGIILSDTDNGATGMLYLGSVTGTFGTNNALTDSGSGSATINGTLTEAWSGVTNIVDLVDSDNHLYTLDITLGNESSGQKSTNLVWSFRDKSVQPEVEGGSILHDELNFLNIMPQGDETYKGYKGDLSTEFTGGTALPCHETNKDNIFDSDASHWVGAFGGVGVIGNTTPCLVWTRRDATGDNEINSLRFTKWGGSSWDDTEIANSDFPWHFPPRIIIASDTTIWVVGVKTVSSVDQVVSYYSEDNGATFSYNAQHSTSSVESAVPMLSPYDSSNMILMWHDRVSRAHSEVVFEKFAILPSETEIFYYYYQQQRLN